MKFTALDARAVDAGLKGGAVRKQTATILRERGWLEKYPGLNLKIAREIWRDGVSVGRKQRQREQRT